jgi:hypothetical protein
MCARGVSEREWQYLLIKTSLSFLGTVIYICKFLHYPLHIYFSLCSVPLTYLQKKNRSNPHNGMVKICDTFMGSVSVLSYWHILWCTTNFKISPQLLCMYVCMSLLYATWIRYINIFEQVLTTQKRILLILMLRGKQPGYLTYVTCSATIARLVDIPGPFLGNGSVNTFP